MGGLNFKVILIYGGTWLCLLTGDQDKLTSPTSKQQPFPPMAGCRSRKEAGLAYLEYGSAGPVAVGITLLLALC